VPATAAPAPATALELAPLGATNGELTAGEVCECGCDVTVAEGVAAAANVELEFVDAAGTAVEAGEVTLTEIAAAATLAALVAATVAAAAGSLGGGGGGGGLLASVGLEEVGGGGGGGGVTELMVAVTVAVAVVVVVAVVV
jgi:hypothetical protein